MAVARRLAPLFLVTLVTACAGGNERDVQDPGLARSDLEAAAAVADAVSSGAVAGLARTPSSREAPALRGATKRLEASLIEVEALTARFDDAELRSASGALRNELARLVSVTDRYARRDEGRRTGRLEVDLKRARESLLDAERAFTRTLMSQASEEQRQDLRARQRWLFEDERRAARAK